MSIYGALQLYNMNNDYSITYVRTIIESGDRSLGALPGEMQEKINPSPGDSNGVVPEPEEVEA